MFFYLSKILSGLFFPLPLLLLALVAAFVFYRRRFSRLLLGLSVLTLYGLSLYPVAGALISILERQYPAVPIERIPKADAVVLLGGMINPTIRNRPGEPEFIDSVDRLFLAESLLRSQKAPLLIISGGSGFLMQQEASEAVLLLCFRARGFSVISAPADFYYTGSKNFPIEAVFPSPSALRLSTIAIKEYIGRVAYYFAGYF